MENIQDHECMAKLELPDDERRQLSDWVGRLISSFDAMKNINIDGTEPLWTVLDIQNVLREDVSVKMLSRDELLANAPMQHDGYFQVPRTL